jgi:hypothetical protein
VTLFSKDGSKADFPTQSKQSLARKLLAAVLSSQ